MNKHRIGALVVTDKRKVQGMFTERDILTRLVAKRRDAKEVKTGEVMTSHVVCCWPRTKVAEARKLMRNRRIRHLPVVDDDGKLLGMISIRDLNAFENSDREVTIRYLHQYLYGEANC